HANYFYQKLSSGTSSGVWQTRFAIVGTSDKTVPGWDTIVHGDVKPANMLLTPPDDSVDGLYPTIKLCDFGTSFTMPESIPKVRAWKSTFQYGTSGFWAPEIETAKPLENVPGKFRPVAAHRIHGSHSDVYSLGAVIDQLMDLRFNCLKNHPDFDNPHVIDYYSPELRALVKACRKTQVYSRPAIYDVYQQTSEAVAQWRDAALAEAKSVRTGRPYQSQVLFSKADRVRFDNDPGFRHSYRKTNRAPLLTGKKTTPIHIESVIQTAPPRSSKQLLSSQSTESLGKQLNAASHPDNFTSTSEPKTDEALSTPSSAFVLPGFGAPLMHFHFPPSTISPGAPTPSILAPASHPLSSSQPPPIPTATKPGNKRPLEEDDAKETPTEEEQEQLKRKISRFIEDLPEAPPRPLKRTLRRAGALRRPERRRVRFDVDVEEAEEEEEEEEEVKWKLSEAGYGGRKGG
ncbi:MAG: hypothetical protein Q9184_008192, partial [Pyrenodesmia sp. 2 TL-2023]